MEEILRGIQALFPNDAVVELRVPSKSGTIVGYFKDHLKLAATISELSGDHIAIYYTLNTPNSDLYDDSIHKDKALANVNATRDDQISVRNWLLIDCDPIRVDEAGMPLKDQKVSSTDAEKADALSVLGKIYAYLKSQDWPAPTSADSGNGFHLLYNLGGVPSTEELNITIKTLLQNLAAQFNTDRVKIDTTVYNASRITKAYGSRACKGPDTAERPHRYSHIRKIAGSGEMVTLDMLKNLATEKSTPKKTGIAIKAKALEGYATAETHADKLEEFLEFYELDYKARKKEKNGYSWQLFPCPFNDTHCIGEVGVSIDEHGKKGFKCFHESCQDKHWQEFVEYLQTTTNKRFFFTTNTKEAVPAFADTKTKLKTKSAANIKPEVLSWLWPNRIPLGKLTLFVGHPAMGKGMATMHVAACASAGIGWADGPNVNSPMDALIISSEDAAGDTIVPRLMAAGANLEKIHIFTCSQTPDGEKEFSLDTDLPALRVMLEENPNIKLVIIDPIMNHLGKLKGNSEQELRSALTPLGKIAEHFGIAVILVTHFNKTMGSDAIQRVGGAMGMVGAVRLAWSFTEDKDTGQRKMLSLKQNVVKDVGGLEYDLEGKDLEFDGQVQNIGYIKFGKVTHETIDSLLSDGTPSKISKALSWLSIYLSEGEPKPVTEVYNEANKAGIEDNILKNAYKKLNGKPVKVDGVDFWQLPKVSE